MVAKRSFSATSRTTSGMAPPRNMMPYLQMISFYALATSMGWSSSESPAPFSSGCPWQPNRISHSERAAQKSALRKTASVTDWKA